MSKELTGKCQVTFKAKNNFVIQMLPEWLKNLVAWRWFNRETNIRIDLVQWENGYEYAVSDPIHNKVYMADNDYAHREQDFDENVKKALRKADELYNRDNK